jgi:hypothetical protein
MTANPDPTSEDDDDATEGTTFIDPAIIVTYQALVSKWVASRALLWQFPALSLTAQAFLIGASIALPAESLASRILLATAVLAIGLASLLIQYRSGQGQHLDLVLIDRMEQEILAGKPELQLRHSYPVRKRIDALIPSLPAPLRDNYLWRFRRRGQWPILPVRISFTWAAMQTLVSIVGALAGILK